MYDIPKRKIRIFILIWAIFSCVQICKCDIEVPNHDLTIKLHETGIFYIRTKNLEKEIPIKLAVQHTDLAKINATGPITLPENGVVAIEVTATGAGHSQIYVDDPSDSKTFKGIYVRVTIYKQEALVTFSKIVGWIYFVTWTLSFYPQVYENWRRKSVIGLNFDFLLLNILGFTLYSMFNLGVYAIPEIEKEYFARHPRGLNPVKLEDVAFAVNAAIATAITIIQCFIYERQGQRVSKLALGIFSLMLTTVIITAILSACNVMMWLDFLYGCSYIKLAITPMKYSPQVYMNYKRKSTDGWSIGTILLDITGGLLSVLEMIEDSFNYDDWVSIFGDPTKFGLGLISVGFDIIFMTQHFILYRHSSNESNNGREHRTDAESQL